MIATRLLLLAIAGVGCSACVHLHDPGKSELATSASDDFRALDLNAVVDAERENRRLILGEEIELVRRSVAVDADLTLLAAVGSAEPVGASLWEQMDVRLGRADPVLAELGLQELPDFGDFCDDPASCGATDVDLRLVDRDASSADAQAALFALPSLDEITEMLDQLDDVRTAFAEIAGVPRPSCIPEFSPPGINDLLSAKQRRAIGVDRAAEAELLYSSFEGVCEDAASVMSPDDYFGTPAMAMQYWIDAKLELEAQQRAAADAKRALDEARKAVKAATPEDKEQPSGQLAEALADLRDKLEGLDKVAKAVFDEEVAAETRNEIDRAVMALNNGVDSAGDGKRELDRTAALIARFGAVLDGLSQLEQVPYDTSLADLLVRRSRAEAELRYARTLVGRAESRVDLRRRQWLAVMQEIDYLQKSRLSLCAYAEASLRADGTRLAFDCADIGVNIGRNDGVIETVECTGLPSCPFSADLDAATKASIPARQAVYEAIAYYYNSVAVGQASYVALRHTEFLLTAQAALDADEFAIDVWIALIAEPVNMLAAYHAAGIKPAELGNLIVNAIGLGSIAVGVSQ